MVAAMLLPLSSTLAQGSTNERERQLEAAGGARGAGLTATDPRMVITNIVMLLLSIVGVILFCFMFYAGFLWFTAAGDDEKVGHAKNIIKTTVGGLLLILVSLSITTYILSKATWAVGSTMTHTVVYDTGLSTESPVIIITRVIQVILALLGAIVFGLMFYSGFTWLTAAGDDEKVGHAKEVLRTTIMGLMVLLLAYSLTVFIISRALIASGAWGTSFFKVWIFIR